ncbi:MAG: hypothetical protein QNJ94_16580 [Alphaproteobacteria bacterium]|nr:hypothetical protein [Alphaproteobacteria bacterium]
MRHHRVAAGCVVAVLAGFGLTAAAEDTLDLTNVPSAESVALEKVLAPSGNLAPQATAAATEQDAKGPGDANPGSTSEQTAVNPARTGDELATTPDEAARVLRGPGPAFATGLGGPLGGIDPATATRITRITPGRTF